MKLIHCTILMAALTLHAAPVNYQRGQARGFELQVRQPDGSWHTVHQGQVFGKIYAKEFAPVTAQQVRLNINAKVIQFDLFNGRK